MYKGKYLKYKNKYLNLKSQIGGTIKTVIYQGQVYDKNDALFHGELKKNNLQGFYWSLSKEEEKHNINYDSKDHFHFIQKNGKKHKVVKPFGRVIYQIEKRGMSKFKNDNPVLCRVIFRKLSNTIIDGKTS